MNTPTTYPERSSHRPIAVLAMHRQRVGWGLGVGKICVLLALVWLGVWASSTPALAQSSCTATVTDAGDSGANTLRGKIAATAM